RRVEERFEALAGNQPSDGAHDDVIVLETELPPQLVTRDVGTEAVRGNAVSNRHDPALGGRKAPLHGGSHVVGDGDQPVADAQSRRVEEAVRAGPLDVPDQGNPGQPGRPSARQDGPHRVAVHEADRSLADEASEASHLRPQLQEPPALLDGRCPQQGATEGGETRRQRNAQHLDTQLADSLREGALARTYHQRTEAIPVQMLEEAQETDLGAVQGSKVALVKQDRRRPSTLFAPASPYGRPRDSHAVCPHVPRRCRSASPASLTPIRPNTRSSSGTPTIPASANENTSTIARERPSTRPRSSELALTMQYWTAPSVPDATVTRAARPATPCCRILISRSTMKRLARPLITKPPTQTAATPWAPNGRHRLSANTTFVATLTPESASTLVG